MKTHTSASENSCAHEAPGAWLEEYCSAHAAPGACSGWPCMPGLLWWANSCAQLPGCPLPRGGLRPA